MANLTLLNKSVTSFVYQGGSRKGEVRHVYIFNNKGENGNVICWDFEQEQVRKYDPRKIESVAAKNTVVKTIDVSLLPKMDYIYGGLSIGESMADKIRQEGKWAVWDKDTGLVTVVERPKTSYLVGNVLTIELKNGKISVENGQGGMYIYDERGISYDFTPEKLVHMINYYNN